MRFWDSSAVVPLCVREHWTPNFTALLREDRRMAVWWTTPVEVASALARLAREGALAGDVVERALDRLWDLSRAWACVDPVGAVREAALRLVRVHPLRAGDALQLSAALVWAEGAPRDRGFVSLDSRLRDAARREGFKLLPAQI